MWSFVFCFCSVSFLVIATRMVYFVISEYHSLVVFARCLHVACRGERAPRLRQRHGSEGAKPEQNDTACHCPSYLAQHAPDSLRPQEKESRSGVVYAANALKTS